MNIETARLLARALRYRQEAEQTLTTLPLTPELSPLILTVAETYVHQVRVINRIIMDDRDEQPPGPTRYIDDWRSKCQSDLIEVFERYGLEVSVGLNSDGVSLMSQDIRVLAGMLGKVKAQ